MRVASKALQWVALVYVTYVLAIWLALSTSIFERIIALDATSTSIEIARGWSWVPGQFELRGVEIRIQDPNLDLKIGLREARTSIQWLALFQRELRLDRLSATGVSATGELRSFAGKREYLEESENRKAREPKKSAGPWLIHIENVDLREFSEFRLAHWKFKGNAHVTGGFELRSGKEAEIYSARVELNEGEIPGLAQAVGGTIDLKLKRFDVEKTAGSECLHYLDGEIGLHANLKFRGSQGPLQLRWRILEGKLADGSMLNLDARPLWLDAAGFTLGGSARVRWEVQTEKNLPNSLLEITSDHIEVLPKKPKAKKITADGVRAQLVTSDLDLRKPFRKITANALAEYLHWGVKPDERLVERVRVQKGKHSMGVVEQRVQPSGPGVRNLKLKGEFVLDGGVLSGGTWRGAFVASTWPASVGVKINGAIVDTTLFPGEDFIQKASRDSTPHN